MGSSRKRKVRVEFRKNRQKNQQKLDLTRRVQKAGLDGAADLPSEERVSGKGALSRYRTIVAEAEGGELFRDVDVTACPLGRVLSAQGLICVVEGPEGQPYECAVRRVLRTLARDARSAVVAGDLVRFRIVGEQQGVVERVEPRQGTLSRTMHDQEHVLVANVDQVLIVVSAAEPAFKPGLIDRYLISAELGRLQPVVCINKADLVDPATLQPWLGLYGQLGYPVLLTSVAQGRGVARLRQVLAGRQTVVSGQSGVGKSSLLNAVEPGLGLKVGEVSAESRKGRHTTTLARLWPLSFGGWVVDTPGIRQMELWNLGHAELAGVFLEFRPFLPQCRFPDCGHWHESDCGVKRAVEEGRISLARYESYLKIRHGEAA